VLRQRLKGIIARVREGKRVREGLDVLEGRPRGGGKARAVARSRGSHGWARLGPRKKKGRRETFLHGENGKSNDVLLVRENMKWLNHFHGGEVVLRNSWASGLLGRMDLKANWAVLLL
jgi:hypothetical protein